VSDTPQEVARALLLADGKFPPSMSLTEMVRRALEQRDVARRALWHLRWKTHPLLSGGCSPCEDIEALTGDVRRQERELR
jgi:hypothetical protein